MQEAAATAREAAARLEAVRERVEGAEARALNTVAKVAHCARQQTRGEFR